MLDALKNYALNALKVADTTGNVLIGGVLAPFTNGTVPALGSFRYTMSEALDEMRSLHEKGEPIWAVETGCIGCKALTWVQNNVFGIPGDHCTQSMDGIPPNLEDSA